MVRWLDRVEKQLRASAIRKDLREDNVLIPSIRAELEYATDKELRGAVEFALHGRFVELSKHRANTLDVASQRAAQVEGGKSKKKGIIWWSKIFYGMLNSLQGAIGIHYAEQALTELTKELEQGLKHQ